MLGESYSDDEDVREVKCQEPSENGTCYDQSDEDGKLREPMLEDRSKKIQLVKNENEHTQRCAL